MSEVKEMPDHERLKTDLVTKFKASSTYLGSFVQEEIKKTSFKVLKNAYRPSKIKKADIIVVQEGVKTRPAIVVKVLKDRTVLYIPTTSTNNCHCMTPYSDRFLGEGCFTRSFSVCTEEYALDNFSGVFEDTKALNQAIKDFKGFININL